MPFYFPTKEEMEIVLVLVLENQGSRVKVFQKLTELISLCQLKTL